MPHPHAELFAAELEALRAAGLSRSTDTPTVGVDLTSNDYLGLSTHPALVEAAVRALRADGAGAGAARLLAGPLEHHRRAERHLAEWLAVEDALLFPSGYQANAGLLGALASREDVILSDRLIHASLIDASRASRASVSIYEHLDLDHLERLLVGAAGARRRLVLTEGVFSMDGDAAPIAALCELCARHDAWLLVDEAHSAGLVGPRGAGAVAEARDAGAHTTRVLAQVVTGGKALGAAGAFVAGHETLRSMLVHRSRAFIFSTAPPPALCSALSAAIEIASDDAERRARCLDRSRRLAEGLDLPRPSGAIVPWVLGGNARTLAVARALESEGFGVRAVRSPTVPTGTERLRLVGHAHNSIGEVEAFVDRARAVLAAEELPTVPEDLTRPSTDDPKTLAARASAGAIGSTARPREPEPLGVEPKTSRQGRPGAPLPPPTPHPQSAGAGVASPGRRGGARWNDRPRPAFVVTGTDTDVGKTVLSAIALRAALRSGTAGYWKPVQTGSDDDTSEVRRLAGAPGSLFASPLRHYPLPASPHEAAAQAGTTVPVELLTPMLDELRLDPRAERWIVELAGGLLVPYRMDRLQLDWLREIRLPILMAARSGLGTLNHTLLSCRALEEIGLRPQALFLIGDRHPSNHDTLVALSGAEEVFEVPRFASLSAEAIEDWIDGARSHRGRTLCELLAVHAAAPAAAPDER